MRRRLLMKIFPAGGEAQSQRVIHAGFWAVALNGIDQLVIFVRFIILAALLSPTDFGLFGIAVVSMMALDALSRPGVRNALIQKAGDIEPYLDAAWTVQLVRGTLVALCLWIGAPFVAAFVNAPAAESLIRALGVAFFLQELTNPSVLYFHKNLDFDKDFRFRVSGAVADLAVAIVAAMSLRNAWALVFGLTARNLTMLIVSYRVLHYRPRVSLEWRKLFGLLNYGMWIWLMGVLNFIVQQSASVVVGKALSVAALGLFQMAQRIPGLALQQSVVAPMATVAFPAYAKIHNEFERLRTAFLRVASLWAAITMPIAAGIAVVGSDFTRICLGERWMPMVPALILLSVTSLVRSLVATAMPLFMGQGRPRLAFYLVAAEATVIVILIYPFVARWGITGAAATMLVSTIAALVMWYMRLKQRLTLSKRDIGLVVGPPLVSVLSMATAVIAYRYLTLDMLSGSTAVNILWFMAMIALGVLTYVVVMDVCRRIVPGYEPFKGLIEGYRGGTLPHGGHR